MIFIVDFGSKKTVEIAKCLSRLGLTTQVIKWDDSKKTDWDKAKAIILSGAPVLLTETDPDIYLKPYCFLKNVEIPVLGICFGHQLIGMLYGAKIFRGVEIRSTTEIILKEKNLLFAGLNEQTIMEEDHTEGISLPVSFVKLASSQNYEVEAMKHHSKKMYGVQFHPEVSGENGLKLLSNFCGII